MFQAGLSAELNLTLPKLDTPKHYQGNFTKAVIIKTLETC